MPLGLAEMGVVFSSLRNKLQIKLKLKLKQALELRNFARVLDRMKCRISAQV